MRPYEGGGSALRRRGGPTKTEEDRLKACPTGTVGDSHNSLRFLVLNWVGGSVSLPCKAQSVAVVCAGRGRSFDCAGL